MTELTVTVVYIVGRRRSCHRYQKRLYFYSACTGAVRLHSACIYFYISRCRHSLSHTIVRYLRARSAAWTSVRNLIYTLVFSFFCTYLCFNVFQIRKLLALSKRCKSLVVRSEHSLSISIATVTVAPSTVWIHSRVELPRRVR